MSFKSKLFSIAFAILCFFPACNDEVHRSSEADLGPRGLNLIDAQVEQDIPIIEVDSTDSGAEDECCGIPCQCGEEYERQIRCWKTQIFFCTPTGRPPGGDPGLYQQEVILDICDESGEPCEPDGPGDVTCQWEVISMGECEDWLECDPTDPNVVIEESVPCTDIDESGNEYNGIQSFICQKGKILSGPCEPCSDEICDSIDNDCDGVVDEGFYPCESECGVGNSICIDGELIACDAPLPTEEVCDGIDNDCDNDVDEDLIRACSTACEDGVEFCIDSDWTGCTAMPPSPEECNGIDDDCNSMIDDGLNCACPPEAIGLLIPCMEDPLICGQGFKTCECSDANCTETEMTQCFAICQWLPAPNEECDPLTGVPIQEVCNNFDDDCDTSLDEDLFAECYTGPEGTLGVGVCSPGEIMCSEGQWGNYVEDLFVENMCSGEVGPLEEDLCTGQDDNCDGIIENILEDTDILFIVDTSGSMSSTINAVQSAMSMFSAHYADQEVVQWGLVAGPLSQGFNGEQLVMQTNLVPFGQFLPQLENIDDDSTGDEMLYDALFLSIRNLVPPGVMPPMPNLIWDDVTSSPSIQNWNINWRDNANHVVIIFTDEEGQSYTQPETTQEVLINWINLADNLAVYSFSEASDQNGIDGWGPVSIGGGWYPLTINPQTMFDNLMEIIEETACGG